MANFEKAKHYAAQGFPVLLVWGLDNGICRCPMGKKCATPGKHPMQKAWTTTATTSLKKLRDWCKGNPTAHLGIMPKEGTVFVDVDPRNGGLATLKSMMNGHKIPTTPVQHSGGGGMHIIFNGDVSALGKGIDVKRPGRGFIVAAPADHVSGGTYWWKISFDTEIADVPDFLKKSSTPENVVGNIYKDGAVPPKISIDTMREMLSHCNADDYHRWIATGQALKHAYGEKGEALWLDWSRTSEKFEEGDENKWETFDHNRDRALVTLRSIVAHARQNGYKIPVEEFGEHEFSNVKNADDIMKATIGPAIYCVQDRVPSGLVIMGGRPKSKKSWFALQLSIAKSAGGKFMGTKAERCTVLNLALEDNDRRMRNRLEFFGMKLENAPKRLNLVYDWPTGEDGVEKLERWLHLYPDTKLIVIDVLQKFRGPRGKDESVYESDYQTMSILQNIAKKHEGLTILVLHHIRKGPVEDPVEALNGSFGIAGGADAYMILRKGFLKDVWIVHIDGRDWESWDHEFNWEFKQKEGWVQIGVHEADLTDTQKDILELGREKDFLTPTICSEKKNISKQRAHQLLKTLVKKGVMRIFAGKYYVNVKVDEKRSPLDRLDARQLDRQGPVKG